MNQHSQPKNNPKNLYVAVFFVSFFYPFWFCIYAYVYLFFPMSLQGLTLNLDSRIRVPECGSRNPGPRIQVSNLDRNQYWKGIILSIAYLNFIGLAIVAVPMGFPLVLVGFNFFCRSNPCISVANLDGHNSFCLARSISIFSLQGGHNA
jgi:hypothetical protein